MQYMTLKAPVAQQLIAGRTTLVDMPDRAPDGSENLIEAYGLKPPGMRHIWCYVSDNGYPGPTGVPSPKPACLSFQVHLWPSTCMGACHAGQVPSCPAASPRLPRTGAAGLNRARSRRLTLRVVRRGDNASGGHRGRRRRHAEAAAGQRPGGRCRHARGGQAPQAARAAGGGQPLSGRQAAQKVRGPCSWPAPPFPHPWSPAGHMLYAGRRGRLGGCCSGRVAGPSAASIATCVLCQPHCAAAGPAAWRRRLPLRAQLSCTQPAARAAGTRRSRSRRRRRSSRAWSATA